MTWYAAFYKGTRPFFKGGLYNRLGRYLDRGPYSHCEVYFSDGWSASSSFIDGGVRFKKIGYSSVGSWDFIELPDAWEKPCREWYYEHRRRPYDVWGNIRFFCGLARDSDHAWFCSESMAASFGFPEPYRYGPNGLATSLKERLKVSA